MAKMTKAQLERAHQLAVHIERIDEALADLKEEGNEAAMLIGAPADDEDNEIEAGDGKQVIVDKATAARILASLKVDATAELKRLGIEI